MCVCVCVHLWHTFDIRRSFPYSQAILGSWRIENDHYFWFSHLKPVPNVTFFNNTTDRTAKLNMKSGGTLTDTDQEIVLSDACQLPHVKSGDS